MSKSNCRGCSKSFNTSTLDKNNGNCGRCSKKDIVYQQVPQMMMVPQQVPQMMIPQLMVQKSTKPKKSPIPPKLRQEVWETNIGDKFWGNCFSCSMRINALEFACGHIVSEFNGGKMVLDNMKVVCKSCNSKMGTQNMLEFKEKRYSSKEETVPPLTNDILNLFDKKDDKKVTTYCLF